MDAPTSPFLSVVIPVYNEAPLLETTLDSLLKSLPKLVPSFEIILAENGSTDGTKEIARALEQRNTTLRVISYPWPNYGEALKMGFLCSQGEFVVNFSVDFIDLKFLKEALALVAEYDIVLGSKLMFRGTDQRSFVRWFGSRAYHWLVRLLFPLEVRDTHGIKLLKGDTARYIAKRCIFGDQIFDTELVVRATLERVPMREISLTVKETRPKRASVLKRAVRAFADLLRLRVRLWREPQQRRSRDRNGK